MKNIFSKSNFSRSKNTMNIESGIGRGIKQIHPYSSSVVNIDGIRLKVSNGIINLDTDDKPYKIVVDGEIIRR